MERIFGPAPGLFPLSVRAGSSAGCLLPLQLPFFSSATENLFSVACRLPPSSDQDRLFLPLWFYGVLYPGPFPFSARADAVALGTLRPFLVLRIVTGFPYPMADSPFRPFQKEEAGAGAFFSPSSSAPARLGQVMVGRARTPNPFPSYIVKI